MWSQFAISSAAAALFLGCGGTRAPSQDLSDHSSPAAAPDLTLHDVAFARLTDGRVAARGTARVLDYYRAGGRLAATVAAASLHPDADTGYAMFGDLQLAAPRVAGDLGSKRGSASGGVTFRAARGDRGETERLLWDGPADRLSGDRPVAAEGPGYVVRSEGFSARADGSDVTLTGGVAGTLQPDAPAAPSDATKAASRKRKVPR
jgi:lipopolysaccharide export system protein LptC